MKETGAQATRRGRPPTGNIQPWRDSTGMVRFRARIRLADKTFWPLEIDAGTTEKEARALALKWQRKELATNELYKCKMRAAGLPVGGETTGEWFERYSDAREAAGVLETHRNIDRWQLHIGPLINHVPIVELDRSHIVTVRDRLDQLSRSGKLSAKTALNIWSVLTRAMKEATSSKVKGLQVRETNPCSNVQPPDRGESRTRPWLTPKELYRLLDSRDVPLFRRQLFAIAAYTFVRPGELAAAKWGDVDFELGVLHVRRALHWDTGTIKETKSRSGRRSIPIHPNLMPLLQAMRQVRDAALWPAFNKWDEKQGGITFRRDLLAAGVTRPELHQGTEDTMPADLRSLRTTGATLAAVSGIQGKTLERRIGHAGGSATIDRYVGVAEDISKGAMGEPFGPLPPSLIEETISVMVSVNGPSERSPSAAYGTNVGAQSGAIQHVPAQGDLAVSFRAPQPLLVLMVSPNCSVWVGLFSKNRGEISFVDFLMMQPAVRVLNVYVTSIVGDLFGHKQPPRLLELRINDRYRHRCWDGAGAWVTFGERTGMRSQVRRP